MSDRPLQDHVALVAGGTRGAGRGIAIELGGAGATVYVSGRSSRAGGRSPMGRPETIEETAELVSAAGGHGIAVRVDHSRPGEVRDLVARMAGEQDGRLDVLVNDVWGGDPLIAWETPFWEHSLEDGLQACRQAIETHLITSHAAVPLMVRRGRGLVIEVNWRGAIASDAHLAFSETPRFVGRAAAALAADPGVARWAGQGLSSWRLAREYGFDDVDGRRPDWGAHYEQYLAERERTGAA